MLFSTRVHPCVKKTLAPVIAYYYRKANIHFACSVHTMKLANLKIDTIHFNFILNVSSHFELKPILFAIKKQLVAYYMDNIKNLMNHFTITVLSFTIKLIILVLQEEISTHPTKKEDDIKQTLHAKTHDKQNNGWECIEG